MSAAHTPARPSWFASPPPALALEITATRVSGVALGEQGGSLVIAAHAIEPLPEGAAAPALNAPNVLDEQALAAAIGSVLSQLGHRVRRLALVLPDSVGKVSLLRFEKVPAKAQDLDQLIRWQVRKSAPFRIEDAQVAWAPGVALPGGGREYLVTAARRDIVRSYERACELAGGQAGIVDLASFNHINAVLAAGHLSGDWLLVSVAADYATLAVVRDGDVVFFRNRSAAGEGELADLVHQTAMYHEDRLGGGGFARVVLAGASVLGPAEAERLRVLLEERIGVCVEPIDVSHVAALRDRIAAPQDLRDALAAPVGILVRERGPRSGGRRAEAEVA